MTNRFSFRAPRAQHFLLVAGDRNRNHRSAGKRSIDAFGGARIVAWDTPPSGVIDASSGRPRASTLTLFLARLPWRKNCPTVNSGCAEGLGPVVLPSGGSEAIDARLSTPARPYLRRKGTVAGHATLRPPFN